jgi:hypothetical protein
LIIDLDVALLRERRLCLCAHGKRERRSEEEGDSMGDWTPNMLEMVALARDRELSGRQSQTWVRFPALGCKAVRAHVSTPEGKALWSCR